jgi:alpha-glucosidase (family GH31 glycosyl hydrolase)
MGFKLSLWLCVRYDLFRYEEQCAAGVARKMGLQPDIPQELPEIWEDDRITGEIKDPRLTGKQGALYKKLNSREAQFQEGSMPWFEHLKKFVDQGVQCFKLDGSCQVTDWNGGPKGRKWANGASNEENHNLYPLVYGKQMARGYEEYTAKRSMVYSAGGYAGVQQYVATWAGDTGGGARPCASLLNLGMSGHPNQSCDMGIFSSTSLHFGMLQTWSQQNNWAYWYQPWYQRREGLDNFRAYLKLRYRLFPYIYTAAAHASRTGWPVLCSLPFAYPGVPEYDECKTTYLLGPDLLVGAFTDTLNVPEGLWYEWRTDAKLAGPCKVPVAVTPEWGGALYVRAGAVIPTWPEKECIDSGYGTDVILEAYAGADGESELYEDDGLTLKYRSGLYARIPLRLSEKDGATRLTVGPRKGAFGGSKAKRNITVRFHALARKPMAAAVGGEAVEGVWCEKSKIFTVGPVSVGAGGATFEVVSKEVGK